MITGINHIAHIVPDLEIATELFLKAKTREEDFRVNQLPTRRTTVEIIQTPEERLKPFFKKFGLPEYNSWNREECTFNLNQNHQVLLDTAELGKPEIHTMHIGHSGVYIKEERAIPEQNSCIVIMGFLDPITKKEMEYPTYEFIEPMTYPRENDGVSNFLAKYPTGRRHHLALTVDNLEETIKLHGDENFVRNKITGKVINIGVHDTRTAFFTLKYSSGLLVELVQP